MHPWFIHHELADAATIISTVTKEGSDGDGGSSRETLVHQMQHCA
jgi:hypothetical protein